jgi:hypothetical protein
MKKWNTWGEKWKLDENFVAEKRKKADALNILHRLEKNKESRDLNDNVVEFWLQTKLLLDDFYLKEEKYWKLRSKEQWLKEGDLNTAYFYIIILNMIVEGEHCDSLPQIESQVVFFYKQLFGEPHEKHAFFDSNFWNEKYIRQENNNLELEKSFIEVELKEAIFASDASDAHNQINLPSCFINIFG